MDHRQSKQTPGVFEQWRPCPGLYRYEVSNLGNIRRVSTGRLVKAHINARQRNRFITVYAECVNGKPKHRTKRVAPLIALAFLGPPPPGLEIDHVNGIKTDDRAANLRYVTKSENITRSYHLQNLHPNRRSGDAPVTQDEHDEMVRLAREGVSQVEIGKKLGRNNSTVCRHLSGKVRARVSIPPAQRPRSRRELMEDRLDVVRGMVTNNPNVKADAVVAVLGVRERTAYWYLMTVRGRVAGRDHAITRARAILDANPTFGCVRMAKALGVSPEWGAYLLRKVRAERASANDAGGSVSMA